MRALHLLLEILNRTLEAILAQDWQHCVKASSQGAWRMPGSATGWATAVCRWGMTWAAIQARVSGSAKGVPSWNFSSMTPGKRCSNEAKFISTSRMPASTFRAWQHSQTMRWPSNQNGALATLFSSSTSRSA